MIVKEYDCQRIELAKNSKDGIIRTAGRASKYGLERGPRKKCKKSGLLPNPPRIFPPWFGLFYKKNLPLFLFLKIASLNFNG